MANMIKICKSCLVEFTIVHPQSNNRVRCFVCSPLRKYSNINDEYKQCKGECRRILPNTEKHFHISSKYLTSQCRDCVNKKATKKRSDKKIRAIFLYGSDKCSICKYDKSIQSLHFHHIDPLLKDRDITRIHISKLSIEVSKCLLVCANCHMEIHDGMHPNILKIEFSKTYNAKHMKRFQDKIKKQWVDYKGGKCILCNYDKSLRALNFHHRNPLEKEFTMSHNKSVNFEELKKELDKCDILCANCHHEHHDI